MTTKIKTAIGADDGAILECSGIERRFGGIVAVTGVTSLFDKGKSLDLSVRMAAARQR